MEEFLKKIVRHPAILFLFVICLTSMSIKLNGQTDMGWKINIGASIVDDKPKAGSDFYTEKYAPSINLGYFFKFKIAKKFSFRTAADFDLIQSKETRRLGYSYSRHIGYLSFPLLIETNSSRFNVGVGIRSSYKLFGGGNETYEEEGIGYEIKIVTKLENTEYKFYDIGAILNLSCFITQRVRVECKYYHGLSNIHSEKSVRSNVIHWKTRQILLGIAVSIN